MLRNSVMSAPAMKNFSPAPVQITALTSASASAWLSDDAISARTWLDRALAGGWSTVMVATGPAVSYLTKSKVEAF